MSVGRLGGRHFINFFKSTPVVGEPDFLLVTGVV